MTIIEEAGAIDQILEETDIETLTPFDPFEPRNLSFSEDTTTLQVI